MANQPISGLVILADPDDADLIEVVDSSNLAMAPAGTNSQLSLLALRTWLATYVSGGHTIQSEGVPVPQRSNLNATGDGVTVTDNAGGDATNLIINNAQVANVGGAVEVYARRTGADPVTVEFRTLRSSDGSVILTQETDTVDLQATGVGGGESNRLENIGAGTEVGLTVPNGVNLQLRTLDPGTFELNVDQVRIIPNTFDAFGSAAAVQTSLNTHTGTPGIHVPVASMAGAGLTQSGDALNVTADATLTVTADLVAVTGGPSSRGEVWSHGVSGPASIAPGTTGHPLVSGGGLADNTFQQLSTAGLADSIVTTAKMANMAANTLRARVTTTGAPQDIDIEALADGGTPAAADVFLGKKASGDLVKFAGTVVGGVTAAGILTNGYLTMGAAGDSEIQITAVHVSQVVTTVGANTLTNQNTFTGAVVVGAPTGGAQGNGTLNAESLLVNGVPIASGTGDVVGPASASDNALAAFDGATGKLIKDSTIPTPAVVRTDASKILGAGVGLTGTTESIASSGTPYVPDLSTGQYAALTGSTSQQIDPPTALTGHKSIYIPAAITPSLGGTWDEVTGGAGTGNRTLHVVRYGTGEVTAQWSQPA